MSITVIKISEDILKKVYGVNSIEEVRALQAEEQKKWCTDKSHTSSNSYYVPDGVRKDEPKHHYRCPKCHKITQVG